jgi:hypothetical protein
VYPSSLSKLCTSCQTVAESRMRFIPSLIYDHPSLLGACEKPVSLWHDRHKSRMHPSSVMVQAVIAVCSSSVLSCKLAAVTHRVIAVTKIFVLAFSLGHSSWLISAFHR